MGNRFALPITTESQAALTKVQSQVAQDKLNLANLVHFFLILKYTKYIVKRFELLSEKETATNRLTLFVKILEVNFIYVLKLGF